MDAGESYRVYPSEKVPCTVSGKRIHVYMC